MMQTVVHKSDTRGHANHGWLEARHSFSFAGHYNPERVHFGMLRVLNDDIVQPGMGFGTHPHDNMEIVTIPLKGVLRHRDSMGHEADIRAGEVQVMSAGSGIEHSEFNGSREEPINLLQTWVFPKEQDIEPRYDQRAYDPAGRVNTWQTVVSPDKSDTTAMWINQDAWFSLANIAEGKSLEYTLHKKGNGAYVFLIEGRATVAGHTLDRRDAVGVWETDRFTLQSETPAEVLVIEVPMR